MTEAHAQQHREDPARPFDVAIVGGGLAGLAAATYLGRAGMRTLVLERSERLGGRARTDQEAGFHLNQGPHALYRCGAAAAVLEELGVSAQGGMPPVRGGVLRAGRWHALPGDALPLMTSRLLTAFEKFEFARFMTGIGRVEAELWDAVPVCDWLEQSLRGTGSRRLVEMFVRLSTYVNAPQHLSAGSAIRQLAMANEGVLYVHDGWHSLVHGLAASAAQGGATIRTGSAVERIGRDGTEKASDSFRLTLSGEQPPVRARRVLLAGAPGLAARLFDEAPGTTALWRERARSARAACLDVGLAVASDELPHPERLFALGLEQALYFSVHSAHARLAVQGSTLVHLARYLPVGETPDPKRDRALLEETLEQIQPGTLARASLTRFLAAMVVHHAIPEASRGGTRGRTDVADPELPGLYLAGDWVGPTGMLADASLASAKRAAERIVSDAAPVPGAVRLAAA